MKRKIILLTALCLAISIIGTVIVGCGNKENTETTDGADTATTTTATTYTSYVDNSEGKVLKRTVTFGGNEIELTYSKTEDRGDGNIFDIYVSGDDKYEFYYNTDTFYMIGLSKLVGVTSVESEDAAMEYALEYFIGQFGGSFPVSYKMTVKDNGEFYTVTFDINDGYDTGYTDIRFYISVTAGVSEIWFTKK
jgi:hypothetical protein